MDALHNELKKRNIDFYGNLVHPELGAKDSNAGGLLESMKKSQ